MFPSEFLFAAGCLQVLWYQTLKKPLQSYSTHSFATLNLPPVMKCFGKTVRGCRRMPKDFIGKLPFFRLHNNIIHYVVMATPSLLLSVILLVPVIFVTAYDENKRNNRPSCRVVTYLQSCKTVSQRIYWQVELRQI